MFRSPIQIQRILSESQNYLKMKLPKLLMSCMVLFMSIAMLNGQAKFDVANTLTLKEMSKLVKKDKSFAYPDFVKANINQRAAGSEFTSGVIQNQMINFSANENAFYVKDGENVYKLNSESIVGVYGADDGRTNFMRSNKANPDLFCEAIHYTEEMFVYVMKDETYARIAGQDVLLPLNKGGIESTFGITSNSIDTYIKVNNLDFNDKNDLKMILRQYQSSAQ